MSVCTYSTDGYYSQLKIIHAKWEMESGVKSRVDYIVIIKLSTPPIPAPISAVFLERAITALLPLLLALLLLPFLKLTRERGP